MKNVYQGYIDRQKKSDPLVYLTSKTYKGRIAPEGKMFYIMHEPQKSSRRHAHLLLPASLSEKDLADAKAMLSEALRPTKALENVRSKSNTESTAVKH